MNSWLHFLLFDVCFSSWLALICDEYFLHELNNIKEVEISCFLAGFVMISRKFVVSL